MTTVAAPPITGISNYIAGHWQEADASEWLDVVNPATGEARLRVQALKIEDYHDILNSIGLVPPTPPLPSRVSFDVRWAGHGDPVDLHDPTFGFMGHYVTGPASISFTASNDGSPVVYRSDPTGQTNVGLPAVGTEQNGVFFP